MEIKAEEAWPTGWGQDPMLIEDLYQVFPQRAEAGITTLTL